MLVTSAAAGSRPGVSRIPKPQRLALGPIDDRQVPVLEYREPFTFDCFDGDWCARNRVNSSTGRLEAKHGGKIRFGDGFFVHTFNRLVPPEKYFKEHPEYFSLVKGKRLKDHVAALLHQRGRDPALHRGDPRRRCGPQPEAFVFSVSQNDWRQLLRVRQVPGAGQGRRTRRWPRCCSWSTAWPRRSRRSFPTRPSRRWPTSGPASRPRRMRPRPNVIIRLCSIECCFSHPLATCDSPANRAFREDAGGLGQGRQPALGLGLRDRFLATTCCRFPTSGCRNDNIRFFVAQQRQGHLRAGHLRHAAQRAGRRWAAT